MFNKQTYVQRRALLKKEMAKGLLLFLGNDEYGLNYEDNTFRFRQDSSFLYYFGIPDAGLSAIIDIDNNKEIIFGNELTLDDIVWMGQQSSLHEKAEKVGTTILPASEIKKYLQQAQLKGQIIHFLPPYRAEHKLKLIDWLGITPAQQQASIPFIRAIIKQRRIKSAEEIEEIEKACNVTAEMHLAAIKVLRPGIRESDVVAAMESIAISSNYELSFATIATINGQTLHNHAHNNVIKDGDLFLIDAGAETEMGYAGDMSSTICVGKKFTERQKQIIKIQNKMYDESVKALRPGIPYIDVYNLSAKIMVDCLKEIGLMKGNTNDAVENGAFAMFYPHGLGHMMGLDVHDMENMGEIWVGYDGKPKSTLFGRKSLRLAIPLEPGFVHTIEPGIYFIPELINKWRSEKKFTEFINYDLLDTYKDFGGVRNESDYLITQTGSHRLGKIVPKSPEEIEAMKQ